MPKVKGIYKDGKIQLQEEIPEKGPIEVTITYERDNGKEQRINLSNFSFKQSQKLLRNLKGSLSDEIIEERQKSR